MILADLVSGDVLRAAKLREIYVETFFGRNPAHKELGRSGTIDLPPFATVQTGLGTSFVDLPLYTLTLTTRPNKRVFVNAVVYAALAAANTTIEMQTVIDGVAVTNSQQIFGSSAQANFATITYTSVSAVVAAGPHTVKLQVRRVTGNSVDVTFYKLPAFTYVVREY